MAIRYWVAKDSTFGSSAGAGTEANPYVGALAARAALGTGVVSGDTLMLMGEYGKVGLADAADFSNTSAAALTNPLLLDPANLTLGYGGIQFGNDYTTSSNANGIRFTARGDLPYHVDMRGGTTNAQRMRAALVFSGLDIEVDGWRVAAPDFNYIGNGSDRITPASGSSATYAAECSFENAGILVWSALGADVHDNVVWGSDAFCRAGIAVLWFGATGLPTYENKPIYVRRNVVTGAYAGIIVETEGSINSDTFRPMQGCHVYVTGNRVSGCRWGSATDGDINNSLSHAGPMSVTGNFATGKGRCIVSHNDLSGDCQDLLQIVGAGIVASDNYLHDASPGRALSSTQTWWAASGNWVQTESSYTTGIGLKMGFGGDGTAGTNWLDAGTGAGTYTIDQVRNKAIRNRVFNTVAAGIAANGDGGMFIHANEVVNLSGSANHEGISAGPNAGVLKQHWVSNNYVKTQGRALRVLANHTVYAYNNILDGADADAALTAATSTLAGANNRTVNNDVTNSGGTLSWSSTTTGAAAYTVGVGPTVGGNCDGAGSLAGITGSRSFGAAHDMAGRRYKTAPAVGPREVV